MAKAVTVAAVATPLLVCAGVMSSIASPDGLAGPDGTSSPRSTPTATAPADRPEVAASRTASVEVRTVTETEEIPFEEVVVDDPSLPAGTTQLRVEGRPGVKTLTYEVTYTDGVETDRKLVGSKITEEPVDRVVARGTGRPASEPEPESKPKPKEEPKPKPKPEPPPECHPNYTGACVPIASDVDCEGGSGDGPAYVRGPVYVIGKDVYRLDHDGDGVACES
ncbi:MAG: G5 domain-containing protein [Micromonosporaceae bacterium]